MTDQLNALCVRILLEVEASPGAVANVERIAREEGLSATVEAGINRKGIGDLPWIMLFYTPPAAFLSAFMAKLGHDAAEDAYKAMSRLISRLYESGRPGRGSISVQAPGELDSIFFPENLPEDALRQLWEISPERLRGRAWAWDEGTVQWMAVPPESTDHPATTDL